MSTARGKRFLRAVLILIIALLVLLFLAQSWLGSGIGRGVVENRLSAALERPVRLEGDFSLRLLPTPGLTGSRLKIYTRDGRWRIVDAGEYLVRLPLRPLLRGDIEVLALRIENAAMDLGRVAGEPSAAPDEGPQGLSLPDIQSLELANVSVHFDAIDSEPYVRIDSLEVDDFGLDVPARLEAAMALVSDASEQAAVFVDGTVTLGSRGVVEIRLSRMDAAVPGWDLRGIRGGLSANLGSALIDVRLEWDDPDQVVRFAAQVDWDPEYEHVEGGYAITRMEFEVGQRRISGSGCLLNATTPVLMLDMASSSLDLDALSALFGKWQAPVAGTVEPGETVELSTSGDVTGPGELPIELAVTVVVEEATFGEAVASGVRLSIGHSPACPATR